MAFKPAEARLLPTLACVGYVDDITPAKETESGMYANCRVSLKGQGASRSISTNLLFRPEWFTPGFDPDIFKDLEFGADVSPEETTRLRQGMKLVYERLFGRPDVPGELAVLCGSMEKYEKLAQAFEAAYTGAEFTGQEVGEIIRDFVIGEAADVGYVLRQQREKTGEKNENGRNVYTLKENYDVQEFFFPTATNKKRYITRAEKAAEKAQKNGNPVVDFRVAFDVE